MSKESYLDILDVGHEFSKEGLTSCCPDLLSCFPPNLHVVPNGPHPVLDERKGGREGEGGRGREEEGGGRERGREGGREGGSEGGRERERERERERG